MQRWLTFDDVCLEFRLGQRAVQRKLREGILVGYWVPKLGKNGTCRKGAWRILDPGIKFARYLEDSRRHIEHVPLLSGREVAQVLQVTPSAIRQLRRRKKIHGQKVGNAVLYAATEIRRILFERERGSRRVKQTYSPIIVNWLQCFIKSDEWVASEVISELMRQAVTLPEAEKIKYTVNLLELFERLNLLLCEIRNLKAAAESCAAR